MLSESDATTYTTVQRRAIAPIYLRLASPPNLLRYARSALRLPLEQDAARRIASIPETDFSALFPDVENLHLDVPDESLSRHGWNVKLHEEILLRASVRATAPKRVFEIGTFDGGTTRYLAEAAPDDATVFTLDLPDEEFDATQSPTGLSATCVGEKHKRSPAAHKVTQLRGNSTTFDFSPYENTIDFVFVDAAHDYSHGLIDSRTALRLAKPGGMIFWHDFDAYWHGLIHAITQATTGLPLRRLAGTALAVLPVP
jgi:predicted O-methyltransferase YrrM